MVLVCHVILQDHTINVSTNSMGKSLSRYVITLPSLVVIGTVVIEICFISSRDLARPRDQGIMWHYG